MHQKDLSTSQTFQALPNSSNECLLSHTKTVAMTKENLVHIRMQKSNIEQFVFNTQIYFFLLCVSKNAPTLASCSFDKHRLSLFALK